MRFRIFIIAFLLSFTAHAATIVPVSFFKRPPAPAAGGGGGPYSGPLLLDLAGISNGVRAAYSVFRPTTNYTGNCWKVRRDDSTEQGIAYVSNYVDTATVLSFGGTGSCWLVTWYDASFHNTNHLTQATAGNQPLVMSSGVLVTNAGLLASILGDGVNDALTKTMSYSGPHFISCVMKQVSWTSQDFCWALNNGANQILVQRSASPGLSIYDSGYSTVDNNAAVGAPFILQAKMHSSGSFFQVNNNTDVTFIDTNPTINSINLFAYTSGGASAANVHIQEFIYWGTAFSSDERTMIRTNTNARLPSY